MYSFLGEGELQDPIITKEILSKLTPAQNTYLESGRLLINPITGDTIVPIKVSQTQIARIVINIY
jgi:hypothetical protein|tara:strand:- start:541 stop:735 length:195 start_codon:yes stop_codon:yes gene_type:complete